MSCFQSIAQEYRKTDYFASGIPIALSDNFPCMRDIDRSEFGARLFGARQEAKVSQAALGKACGLGQSVIAELERQSFCFCWCSNFTFLWRVGALAPARS